MPRTPSASLFLCATILLGLNACDQETDRRSCTLKGCAAAPSGISFDTDDGGLVAPRGEIRHSQAFSAPWAFDCRDAQVDANDLSCTDGVVTMPLLDDLSPGVLLEIRFALQDGTMSDWEEVPLSITAHTLEDFNGPGCHCTYYAATASPVTLPPGTLRGVPHDATDAGS